MLKNLLVSLFIATFAVSSMITGCTVLQNRPSVCDEVVGRSILCETADKLSIKIEDAGNVILVANTIAIAEGLYTKEQFDEIVNALLDLLDYEGDRAFITYDKLKGFIIQMVEKYPGLFMVARNYLDMFLSNDNVITPADRGIITGWLAGQLTRVEKTL